VGHIVGVDEARTFQQKILIGVAMIQCLVQVKGELKLHKTILSLFFLTHVAIFTEQT
jgi:hypothetical protein